MSDPLIDGVPHVVAADAAKEAGLPRNYIARLVRRGLLRGRKLGSQWFIERTDLDRLITTRENHRVDQPSPA
jgi:excisionase family DNA binding protein